MRCARTDGIWANATLHLSPDIVFGSAKMRSAFGGHLGGHFVGCPRPMLKCAGLEGPKLEMKMAIVYVSHLEMP